MSLSRTELFEAIKLARPLLILFICIAHMPGIQGYQSSFDQYDDISTLFAVYLKDFMARGAVPILTVVSGYLAVFSFQKRSYLSFIATKTKRLFVPFIVWNLLMLLACWVLYLVWDMNFQNISEQSSLVATVKAVLGIYQLPINAPTYFLRDLFVIMLLLPVLHFFCQSWQRLLLFSVVYLFIYWNAPGVGFYLGSIPVPVMIRMDMILFFCVGYFLALHEVAIPRMSVYGAIVLLLIMGGMGGLFSMVASVVDPSPRTFVQWRAILGALFVCIAPAILLTLLYSQKNLLGRFLGWFSPYSFTLFLSHILSAYVFMIVVRFELGWLVKESSPVYEQILYLLTYLVCVVVGALLISFCWQRVRQACITRGDRKSVASL